MKFSTLSSLGDFNTKKLGLIVSFAWLIVELAIRIRGVVDQHVITPISIMFLLSLFWAVFSKENVDDERFQAVRYFSFKTTMQLFPLAVVSLVILKYNIEPLNYAIGVLIGYLMIYYLCVFFNPEFIFKEKTRTPLKKGLLLYFAIILIGYALFWLSEILKM
jgi:hypothetical protein